MFLDLWKAFDKVDHYFLLYKFCQLITDSDVLLGGAEYLRKNTQCVLLSGIRDGVAEMTSGVLLGPFSVLSSS